MEWDRKMSSGWHRTERNSNQEQPMNRSRTHIQRCLNRNPIFESELKDTPPTPHPAPSPDPPHSNASQDPTPRPPPVPLSSFLTDDLAHTACRLALQRRFDAVQILLTYHHRDVWPFRFAETFGLPGSPTPSVGPSGTMARSTT